MLLTWNSMNWVEYLTNLNLNTIHGADTSLLVIRILCNQSIVQYYISGLINIILTWKWNSHSGPEISWGEIWKVFESEEEKRFTTSCQLWVLMIHCYLFTIILLIVITMTLYILFIILVTTRWIWTSTGKQKWYTYGFRTMCSSCISFLLLAFIISLIKLYYLMKWMEFDRYLAFSMIEYWVHFIFIKYHGYYINQYIRVRSTSIFLFYYYFYVLISFCNRIIICITMVHGTEGPATHNIELIRKYVIERRRQKSFIWIFI